MITFTPIDTEQAIWQRAETYSHDVLAARAQTHDSGVFPADSVRELAALQLMAIKSQTEFGGLGGSAVAYAGAMRAVARGCASTAVTMAVTNMVGEMITRFGTDSQKQQHNTRIASGEYTAAAFALSEAAFGSDAAGLQCKAVLSDDGQEYVLDGGKLWITSGDKAGVALVMARTSDASKAGGISAFLVDPKLPGFSAGRHERKMGLRGSSTVALRFDGLRIPASALLGQEGSGFTVAMTALDGGRCGIGAQAIGIAEGALRALVHISNGRHRTDRAAGTDQLTGFGIADIATRLEAAWLMVLRASALLDAGVRATREAAMAKVFATEAANFATQRAVELAGVEGLMDDGPISRAFRDVRVSRIYEGTSEVQRIVIGRELVRSL